MTRSQIIDLDRRAQVGIILFVRSAGDAGTDVCGGCRWGTTTTPSGRRRAEAGDDDRTPPSPPPPPPHTPCGLQIWITAFCAGYSRGTKRPRLRGNEG